MQRGRGTEATGDGGLGESILMSFVVVNRNGREILQRCLLSVFSQELDGPFEVIVVDDASTDGSVDMVKESFPQARLVVQERNKGPAAAKNAGATVAKGRYLAFLDNDVVLEKSWARSMVDALESYPGAGAGASHLLLEGPEGCLNSTGGLVNLMGYAWERGIFLPDSSTYAFNREISYACSAAMAVKREIFELVGGFDPRYFYLYEDVDLGWRINAAGFRVVYVPEARAYHRLSATMGSRGIRNEYLSLRNRIYTILKNAEARTLRVVLREAVYRIFHDGKFYTYGNCEGGLLKTFLPLRALAWNLIGSPWVFLARKRLRRTRRVSDAELIDRGVLLPTLSFPDVGTDPRPAELSQSQRIDGVKGPIKERLVAGKDKCHGLLYGWYTPERNAAGLDFRWTKDRAGFVLRRKKACDTLFLITLEGNPEGGSTVELWIDGRSVGVFKVGNGLCVHRFPLPPETVRDDGGRGIRVDLHVTNPFVPALQGSGMDGRVLGIGVVAAGTVRLRRKTLTTQKNPN